MHWIQKELAIGPRPRGCHLVTSDFVDQLPELARLKHGLCHFFMLHTSASLTLNENADPDVPLDLAMSLDRLAPEGAGYRHTCEGPDDMPAHIKASLMGPSLTIPITGGQLVLGTWQGIYFNEHRDHGGRRKVFVTAFGESE